MTRRIGASAVLADASNAPVPFSHPSLGPVQFSAVETSDDPEQQVSDTISLMRRYAVEDSTSPMLRADVVRAWVSGDPIGDTFGYIKSRLQFVGDEATAEPLQSSFAYPIVETLCRPCDMAVAPWPQGDCDDFSMYGAAHLIARGVPVSFVTVAADAADPTAYSHVYLVAYPQSGPYAGRRVPLDISHGPYPGWETPNRFGKRKEWPCQGPDLMTLLLVAGSGFLIYKALGRIN